VKALLIGYSFTGQADRAMGLAAATLESNGIDVRRCLVDFADPALRLRRPMRLRDVKHWTGAAQRGDTLPVTLSPDDALSQRYDFIGLFSNTWQNNPSVPIRSLLAMPAFHETLRDTPFAVYVICRRLWKVNARIVQAEAETAGGRCVGVECFRHQGGPIGSLIRNVSYLLSSGAATARFAGLRLPLPSYGLSNESLSRIAGFTTEVANQLPTDAPRDG